MTSERQYAPVLIPTLCRFEHFKRCIESLAACTGSQYTDVFIGLDYPAKEAHREGYEKIKQYLESCGNLGFKTLNVIQRPHNYGFGPNGNAFSLRREVYKKYDTIIVSEDDNEFAPCFLDFMNQALTKYRDDERVRTVGAYLPPIMKQSNEVSNVLFTYSTSAWGMGIWKHKEGAIDEFDYKEVISNKRKSWKLFRAVPGCWVMLYRMLRAGKNFGDVKRETYNCINHTFQVRPSKSLVRNWGNDGSGTNCVDDNKRFIDTQLLQSTQYGTLDNVEVTLSTSHSQIFFQNLPPRNTLHCWLVLAKYFAIFLKSLTSNTTTSHK